MNQVPVLNFHEFIVADGGQALTTSRRVAAAFGKRHNDVLRAIRDLVEQLPDDRKRNFAQTVERRENPSGGALISSPCYSLTRTGFLPFDLLWLLITLAESVGDFLANSKLSTEFMHCMNKQWPSIHAAYRATGCVSIQCFPDCKSV